MQSPHLSTVNRTIPEQIMAEAPQQLGFCCFIGQGLTHLINMIVDYVKLYFCCISQEHSHAAIEIPPHTSQSEPMPHSDGGVINISHPINPETLTQTLHATFGLSRTLAEAIVINVLSGTMVVVDPPRGQVPREIDMQTLSYIIDPNNGAIRITLTYADGTVTAATYLPTDFWSR